MLLPGSASQGATGRTGKVTLVCGCLMEIRLPPPGLCSCWGAGEGVGQEVVVPLVSLRVTVTPGGVGTAG